jgi:hypothetical protein
MMKVVIISSMETLWQLGAYGDDGGIGSVYPLNKLTKNFSTFSDNGQQFISVQGFEQQ